MARDAHIRAGQQLAALRKARGWTQAHLAEAADCAIRSVQRAEAGRCRAETLLSLAGALDADLRELLDSSRPPVVPVEAERSGGHVLLSKVESGKAILDLISSAVAVKLDHDTVTVEEAAQVGAFLQSIHGWCAVIHELEPAERVSASARIHERLIALQKRGFNVMAEIRDKPLMIEPNQQMPRPVATVGVYRMASQKKAAGRGRR